MTGIKTTGITIKTTGITPLEVLKYLFRVPGRVLFGIRHKLELKEH